ncbi:MAG: AmmeMemoRadiSam system protein B [Acidimicrobiia bacterium]|nr:AmmeMemoRadiSam system protein B [Acidimicrobiia bacterium]
MSSSVRHAAVAGSFYPLDPEALRRSVRHHLDSAAILELGFRLRVLIVPHAGYIYSGPIAGTGYRLLEGAEPPDRVVMLGPSHYVPFSGLALPDADLLATPLGRVAVDKAVADTLLAHPLVQGSSEAHSREHSLEVQLPFLQTVLPDVPVVPLVTGTVDPAAAADLVESILDKATLLLVSSDLSHFHDSATARRLDAQTVAAIERLDPDALDWESACGRTGIQIALHIAARRGYRVQVLDLRNSADTAGSPDRVVGYPCIAMGA